MNNFHEIFQSLLGLKNIKVGFSMYNEAEDAFERVNGVGMDSYLLNNKDALKCSEALCSGSYKTLLTDKKFYTVSDVDKFFKLSKGKAPQYKTLKDEGIKSAILAPIANEEGLMGILEIVSEQPKILNSITELAKMYNATVRILHIAKKDEILTDSQIENKEFLNNFFMDEKHSFHRLTNKKIEEGVQCFVESRDIDMIIMVEKNLNLFQRILFKPTVEEISYHIEIPFLVLHE